MGAPNFALRNAKRYFIIEEPEDADYWFWNDAKEDITNIAVDKHGFQWLENDDLRKEIERGDSLSRSYCAETLQCYVEQEYKDKLGNTWRAMLVPMLRSGYYTGAWLDFYISLHSPDETYTLIGQDVYETKYVGAFVEDYCEWDSQYGDYYTTDDMVTIGLQLTRLVEQLESTFYEWAEDCGIDEYAKVWQGSNGEAGYTNLSEIKRKAEMDDPRLTDKQKKELGYE